jgi:hypothetical protein
MSFLPEAWKSILAPDPPQAVQSVFDVISLEEWKAHHSDAPLRFTKDSILMALYGTGPEFRDASEGALARQEPGDSEAQQSFYAWNLYRIQSPAQSTAIARVQLCILAASYTNTSLISRG